MSERAYRPGIHSTLADKFGFGNRWKKEYDYVMSLSEEEIKKEADAERLKAGIKVDGPAVSQIDIEIAVEDGATIESIQRQVSPQREINTIDHTTADTHEISTPSIPVGVEQPETVEQEEPSDNVIHFPAANKDVQVISPIDIEIALEDGVTVESIQRQVAPQREINTIDHTTADTHAIPTPSIPVGVEQPETVEQEEPSDNVIHFPAAENSASNIIPLRETAPVSSEIPNRRAKEIFASDAIYEVETNDGNLEGAYEVTTTNDIRKALEAAELVAVGDGHGSALKILEHAIIAGMVEMPEDQATEFKRLYAAMVAYSYAPNTLHRKESYYPFKSTADKEAFADLQEEILVCIDSLSWNGDDRALLMIGDVVADRGLSDVISMKILHKLREQGNVTTLAGNHDIEFLVWRMLHTQGNTRIHRLGMDSQKVSMLRATATFRDEHIPYIKAFFNNLTLFHYNEDTKTFFSHANFDASFVAKLQSATGFHTQLSTDTMSSFVEHVNAWAKSLFSDILEKKDITVDDMKLLTNIVWDRSYYATSDDIPFSGIVDRFVHGHDTKYSKEAYDADGSEKTIAVCIDDRYRKNNELDEHRTGKLYLESNLATETKIIPHVAAA